jgi:hypothetical protein
MRLVIYKTLNRERMLWEYTLTVGVSTAVDPVVVAEGGDTVENWVAASMMRKLRGVVSDVDLSSVVFTELSDWSPR